MYPTDLTDIQWNSIKSYLDKTERKRKFSLRSIWNALMYVIKTGCQWRMIPQNFPKWQLVYYYYRKWIYSELFDRILDALRSKVRINKGQVSRATLGIVDSQSVKWGTNRSVKSLDGYKKIKGIKRHIVVDENGFLLAIMATLAHVHDNSVAPRLMAALQECYANVKTVLGDKGYRGAIIGTIKSKFNYLLQVASCNQSQTQSLKPVHQRWVVERTFAWFDNDRRLCRNYELLLKSSEEMVKIICHKVFTEETLDSPENITRKLFFFELCTGHGHPTQQAGTRYIRTNCIDSSGYEHGRLSYRRLCPR